MHEFGIARSICRAAAENNRGRPVSFMRVEIGALAGVLPDALDFCIREVAREEGLGEPEILVNETPARFECECGASYETTEMLEGCPRCGGFQRRIVEGLDIRIRELQFKETDE